MNKSNLTAENYAPLAACKALFSPGDFAVLASAANVSDDEFRTRIGRAWRGIGKSGPTDDAGLSAILASRTSSRG